MRKAKRAANWLTSYGGRWPVYITRLLRYSAIGTVAVILDLLLLFVFVEFLHIFYLVAAAMAFIIAHSSNYYVQREWGFKETEQGIKRSYVYFISFGIMGIFLTIGLLAFMVEYLGLNYLFARWLVSLIVGGFMFFLHYRITFRIRGELPNPLEGRFRPLKEQMQRFIKL